MIKNIIVLGRLLSLFFSDRGAFHCFIFLFDVSSVFPPRLHFPLAWPGLAWPGLAWPGLAWQGMAWHGMAWQGMAWHGMAWHGMAWHGMACHVM